MIGEGFKPSGTLLVVLGIATIVFGLLPGVGFFTEYPTLARHREETNLKTCLAVSGSLLAGHCSSIGALRRGAESCGH
jgi:hypothetical protein